MFKMGCQPMAFKVWTVARRGTCPQICVLCQEISDDRSGRVKSAFQDRLPSWQSWKWVRLCRKQNRTGLNVLFHKGGDHRVRVCGCLPYVFVHVRAMVWTLSPPGVCDLRWNTEAEYSDIYRWAWNLRGGAGCSRAARLVPFSQPAPGGSQQGQGHSPNTQATHECRPERQEEGHKSVSRLVYSTGSRRVHANSWICTWTRGVPRESPGWWLASRHWCTTATTHRCTNTSTNVQKTSWYCCSRRADRIPTAALWGAWKQSARTTVSLPWLHWATMFISGMLMRSCRNVSATTAKFIAAPAFTWTLVCIHVQEPEAIYEPVKTASFTKEALNGFCQNRDSCCLRLWPATYLICLLFSGALFFITLLYHSLMKTNLTLSH